jgi:DNA gyrase subunit A
MRLYKLIGLEIAALMKEHEQTMKNIAEYEKILGSRGVMAKVIIKELERYQKEYGRVRRTEIDNVAEAVVEAPKLEELDVAVLIDRFGYAKTVDLSTYERNKEAADAENRTIILCKNTDKLCIFTNTGNMHLLKVPDLPFGKFREKGKPIDNLSNYDSSSEQFVYMEAMGNLLNQKLLFGTKTSMLKLVDGAEFDVGKRTTVATKLADGDELIFVSPVSPGGTIVMESEKSVFLRISLEGVPQKKKMALGVRGMRLSTGDALTAIYYLSGEDTEPQFGGKDKNIALQRLHICNRDTKGVKRS